MPAKLGLHPLLPILQDAVNLRATDIHISVDSKCVYRTDGNLFSPDSAVVMNLENVNTILDNLLTPEQHHRFEQDKELDFSFGADLDGAEVRFRANCFFERGRPAIALRMIPLKIRTATELGLPKPLMKICKAAAVFFWLPAPREAARVLLLPL